MDILPLPQPATHTIDLYTDLSHAKPMIKGLLHTIFFQRTFPAVAPVSRDIPDLNVTLPAVDDPDIETLVNDRASALARRLADAAESDPGASAIHGHLAVQFKEKRRKKSSSFFGIRETDEDVCWEVWVVDVNLALEVARNEDIKGMMERSIQRAAMKVVEIAGREKSHIPPITGDSAAQGFPYEILLSGKGGTGLAFDSVGKAITTAGGLW